jgi:hypothetical protein
MTTATHGEKTLALCELLDAEVIATGEAGDLNAGFYIGQLPEPAAGLHGCAYTRTFKSLQAFERFCARLEKLGFYFA